MNHKKQIKKMLPDRTSIFVRWETSYNYTTTTSARRGGYDRTRNTYYRINGFGDIQKVDHFGIDPLTGQSKSDSAGIWIVGIPRQYLDSQKYKYYVKELFWGTESPVEDCECVYNGLESSARILATTGMTYYKERNSLNYKKSAIEGKTITWELFFPFQWRKQHWTEPPHNVVVIRDGNIVEEYEIEPEPESVQQKIILLKEPIANQLVLF